MQIEDMVPLSSGSGPPGAVARFAVRLTPEVKLCGLRLRKRPDGYRVTAPAAFGGAAMHFAPALFNEINRAATAAYERHHALDRSAT